MRCNTTSDTNVKKIEIVLDQESAIRKAFAKDLQVVVIMMRLKTNKELINVLQIMNVLVVELAVDGAGARETLNVVWMSRGTN